MKYLSLFSGIGGFEYGIQESCVDLECIGFSEVDKYAKSIYKRQFPTHKDLGDVTKIRTSELPDFDLLVGGFPCQAFSIAGKRRGFDDTRGTLFFEIARILHDKRPKYFLLENVRGLLSHDKGKTFQTIVRVLAEEGYDVRWEVLNSKNFGVPQNRERVFIKGYFRADCGGEVLSFKGKGREVNGTKLDTFRDKKRGYSCYDTLDTLSRTLTSNSQNCGNNHLIRLSPSNCQGNRIYDSERIHVCLNAAGNNDYYKVDEVIGSTQKHAARTDGTYSPALTCAMGNGGGHVPMLKISEDKTVPTTKDGNCFAVTTRPRSMPLHKKQDNYVIEKEKCLPVQTPDYVNKKQNGRRFKEDGEPSYTLTSSDVHGVSDGYRVRRLTPRECERLQGFPDDWTRYGVDDESISDTQRYKCIGNAVTTNVISFIINEMFC